MANDDEKLRIKVEAETLDAQKALRAIKKDLINLYAVGEKGEKLKAAESSFRSLYRTVESGKSKVKDLEREIKGLDRTTDKAQKTFNNFGFIAKVTIGNLSANAITSFSNSIKDMVVSVSRAGVELDALNNTMMAATGGWEQGGREIKWLIDMSNRLGLSFGDVSDSYAKFMTSFTRSGGTINQSRQIFEDLSTAMVSLHLPAERMQGVFIALEQMANKGTVQSEELKRQLGNALPGAFELAAESMGVLPAKLMDMMKKGEVFSKDFLPAFAATVKAALGQSIEIASVQFNASIGRLMTNLDLFKMNVGQLLNDALLPMLNSLVSVASGAAKFAQTMNENRGAVIAFTASISALSAAIITLNISSIVGAINSMAAAIMVNAVTAVEALSMRLWALTGAVGTLNIGSIGTAFAAFGNLIRTALIPAVGELIAQAWALNVALGGLPLIIGAVVGGAVALGASLKEAAKEAGDITPYIGLSQQVVNLTKEVTALDEGTESGRQTLEEYKAQFPTLVEYLRSTGKSFSDLSQEELSNISVMAQHDATMKAFAERNKELASWQSTLSAVFQVTWQNILDWGAKWADGMHRIIVGVAKRFKWLTDFLQKAWGAVKGALGKSIPKEQRLDYLFSQTGFAADVAAKKMSNANENFIKKTKIIQENAKAMREALSTAQYTASGLSDTPTKKSKTSKGKTSKTKTNAETEWDRLNKLISEQSEKLKVLDLQGKKNTDTYRNLSKEYAKNVELRDRINKGIDDLTKKQEKEADLWKKIKKSANEVAQTYEYMSFNSKEFTSAEIASARQLSKSYNAVVSYSEALKNTDGLMKITSRTARDLTNSLVDNLFEPLKEGETVWSRFKDAGISAIKAIATEWVKNKANLMLTGAQAGWGVGSIGGGTFMQKAQLALMGAGQGAAGLPLFGTKDVPTIQKGSDLEGVFNSFLDAVNKGDVSDSSLVKIAKQATDVSDELISNTTPAITELTSSIGSGAMSGMTGLAMSAQVASTAFESAAPALIEMATALSMIASEASVAATAMAALAVSTAAESVAKIPMVGGFLAPVAALATGAGIAAGTALTGAGIAAGSVVAGGGQMIGGAMSGLGGKVSSWGSGVSNIIPHAKGGIVSSPTMFPMQGGNIGVAGEAGAEAIAPVRRMSNGDLGVGAVQPKVTVNNYANAAVEVIKRPDNEMEIKISELNAMLSSSRTNKGMMAAQNRMDSKGRRIG